MTDAAPNPLTGTLDGVRVADFSQIAAGPFCTMLLADMGADVIKIEPPTGDVGRTLGPPFVNGESVVFLSLNRGKRSIVLDLKTEEGRRRALRLVGTADILVESFRPGVAARLGIGPDALRALHPDLIYCSVSAYGQSGPWSGKPGVDGVLQAASGLMSITGAEGEPPSKLQAPVVDMVTGFQATIAILAALQKRRAGHVPGHLDVNLFASSLMLQQVPLAGYFTTGEIPARCGSGAPYATPNEAYETADGHLLIAAYQARRWPTFCSLIDRPDLADDPRYATLPERMKHRAALTRAINERLRLRRTSEWVETLEAADISCAPVADYARLSTSPQFDANDLLITTDHPRAGKVVMPGFAIGGRPPRSRCAAPLLGEHDALLHEWDCDAPATNAGSVRRGE